MQGGQLRIYTEKEISSRTGVDISIGSEKLSRIMISGLATAEVHNINEDSISIVVNGAGRILADGSAHEASFLIIGTGEISSKDLRAGTVHVTMTGAGTAHVYAIQQLGVEISGAGSVHYAGKPREVSKNIRGVGFIAED